MRHINLIMAALLLSTSVTGSAAPAKPAAKKAASRPVAKPVARPATAPARIAPLPDTEEVAALRRAFHFAFPIYEIMRTRSVQLAQAKAAGLPDAVNFILPRLKLADASSREVTTPNNDTLYGSLWLDLAAGPVVVTIPPGAGRYHSAALYSLTTDVTAILGSRTGGDGGRYAFVGPGYNGPVPAGTQTIRSTTNDAWLLVRVLVKGPDDLKAAAELLQGFDVGLDSGRATSVPTIATVPVAPDGKTFLAVVNEALARSAANSALAVKANGFGTLGIGTDWDALSPETRALWTQSLPALRAELRNGLAEAGATVDGWSYPDFAIGEYGDNDLLRARVALGGLGALPRVEAMYLTAIADKDGAALEGSKAYTVTIPRDVPTGAFWSVTMYNQEPDGRLFFVPNAIDRFAVSDQSPQLRSNRDGSYDIFVQASKPSGERVVNWLPAPKGKFVLVFRGYLPRAPFLDGSFRLPPVAVSEVIP
ncbi:MAG: phosphatidylserine decarboxylase [Alphaproteobacteria bacterium]|nr:MAG: phosphatidylserine decarboxylase [Alphaproteobacteria bacterium]